MNVVHVNGPLRRAQPDLVGRADVLAALERVRSRIICLRKANGGQASARNYAMSQAKGEYLLFLDDDDLLEPFAVEALLKATLAEGTAWAAGRFRFMDASGRLVAREHACRWESGDVYERMIVNNLVGPPCTVLVRADVVRKLGGFDETPAILTGEDYDLWLSVARESPIASVAQPVARYRLHHAQSTSNWTRHYEALLKVLEKHRVRASVELNQAFQKAIAAAHFEYGDALYVAGKVREAREHWRASAYGSTSGPCWRRRSRFLKSYLPRQLRSLLRAWAQRWREWHRAGNNFCSEAAP